MWSEIQVVRKSIKNRELVAIDLFCGCGGSTLGLKKAGFQIIGAVEINHLAVETYQKNHPSVVVWESDIRTLDPCLLQDQLGLRKGDLDLMAGCPPCQGFSRLRTKNGAFTTDDPRNDLLFEYVRFVEVFRPRALMMENVPCLADDFRFSNFCTRIKALGYHGKHLILDAADYGVPQRRKRLIFLAGLNQSIPFASSISERLTVRNAIKHLPKAGQSGDPLHDLLSTHTSRVQELIYNIPKDGGSRTSLPTEMWLKCHRYTSRGFKDVYGRMAWDAVAPTITSGCFNPSKGRFLHPEEDRAITLREAAILQGFPENYHFPVDNRSAVGVMIGNALPPPFITAHAKKIKEILLTANTIKKHE